MKIAMPITNGRLGSHFGHAKQFAFVTVTDGAFETEILDAPQGHGGLPRWLIVHRADVVIAKSMGLRAVDRLTEADIVVRTGAPKEDPETLARAYLEGTLPDEVVVCAHHGHGEGRGHGHGHGHGGGHGGGGCGRH